MEEIVPSAPDPSPPPPQPTESPVQDGPITPAVLPELIYSLHQRQRTGLLVLMDGELHKTVYVQEGGLVFAQSTDPDDRLGERLLRKGLLSIRGLEHYGHQVVNAGRRIGGFLIERGLITPAELIQSVQDQVRDIILSLFLWTRGEYSFRAGPLPTREVITLEMNTLEILWKGIHRIQTWSRIRDAVGGLETCYQAVPGILDFLELPLSDRELNLLRFCASPISVGDICDTLPGNNFELCRTLWAFHVMGVLRQVTEGIDGEMS
jgi:hypothetical protein